jgi:hypothetical protein
LTPLFVKSFFLVFLLFVRGGLFWKGATSGVFPAGASGLPEIEPGGAAGSTYAYRAQIRPVQERCAVSLVVFGEDAVAQPEVYGYLTQAVATARFL